MYIHFLCHGLGTGSRVFTVGRSKDKATPTIVITVSPQAVFYDHWSQVRLQIYGGLDPRGYTIGVEFLPGMLAGEKGGISVLDGIDADGHPEMGSSHAIGVNGGLGRGTLGGFFTLDYNGSTYRGLINYHVVCPQ
jgi:hypothetical protein